MSPDLQESLRAELDAQIVNFFAGLRRELSDAVKLQSSPWRSQKDAAIYCQCSERTIRNHVAAGELHEHYIGEGKPIYWTKDLDALIDLRTCEVRNRKQRMEVVR